MKSSNIAAVFLLGFGLFKAQSTINGRVIDAAGQALPFASLSFYKTGTDKLLAAEKITDENGFFQVYVPDHGTYNVAVSYKELPGFSKEYTFTAAEETIAINLPESGVTNINEVVIKKTQPAVVRKVDRVIVNVADNPIATGKSSLELFKLAPGVFVNSGRIFINGVWGTRVMLDGKMLNLIGDDLKNYLQNLRSNEIQSIEVIAHPPAEFDAEGSGGIINIILKKNRKQGINGTVGTEYSIGRYPGYNPYTNLNYKKGKLGLSAGYSYNNAKSYEELEQKRDFPQNGKYDQASNDIQHNKSNRVKVGATYDISEKQYLGASYTGQFSDFSGDAISRSGIVYPDASKNIKSFGSFPALSQTKYHNAGLNYSAKTDERGSRISFITDYTYNNRKGTSAGNSRDFDVTNAVVRDTLFRFHYLSVAKIFTADAKYNWNLKSEKTLSFGVKATNTAIDNSNRYETLDYIWTTVPGLDFDFNYRERIYAGFINLNGDWKGLEYQLGLRGENSDIEGDLRGSQNDNISQNYFSWFPSAFVKKNLNEEGSNYLSLFYNRRIKRPSYFDLNPYKYYIDNYSITTGNPYLRPQFTSSYEISGLWKGKYYTAVSFTHTKDAIAQIIENSPGQELLTVIKANVGTNAVYTATLSAPVMIAKWWKSSNNLLLTYTISESPYFRLERPSFILQTEQEISIGKGYNLSLSGFYTPQMLSGNTVTGPIASVDLGVQRKFLENRLTAKVSVSDIFYTNNFTAKSYFNNTVIDIVHREQSRLFSVSLAYNFAKGEGFRAKKIESSSGEEKSRL